MKTLDQIKEALEGEEFFLEYQPIMSLTTGHCVGAEALIRWQHHGGLVPPDDFIPMIENTPLGGLVTYWTIERTSVDLRSWLEETPGAHLGINVPPDVIGRGGLLYALQKAGFGDLLDRIVMEITERGFPDRQALDALKSRGPIRVAIDDYGTGDGNMKALSQIEADIIKIDKWFVDLIQERVPVPKAVSGLIAFAHAMGCEMVAEGVESQYQADVLSELGVHKAQGWLYAKSLSPDAFLSFYAAHQ